MNLPCKYNEIRESRLSGLMDKNLLLGGKQYSPAFCVRFISDRCMSKTTKGTNNNYFFPGMLVIIFFSGFLNLAAQRPANPYALTDQKAIRMPVSCTVSTDGIAAYINENFETDTGKIRAIYTWIATQIAYDVDKLFMVSFDESQRDKISQTLVTRKGICENYTALFHDLCSKTGIPCYIVEGYTRQNGSIDQIPHSWCAAFIGTEWLMFDPTWAAGYINGKTFTRQFNNDYFMVKPHILIHTHMPFDYLWQFLVHPVSRDEFTDGKIPIQKAGTAFYFQDSIAVFEKLDKITQVQETIRRIENNGTKNNLVRDRLKFLHQELEIEQQNGIVRQYNSAVGDYNTGITHLNAFIQYRNAQFKPLRPDTEIREMISNAIGSLGSGLEKLNEIRDPDAVSAANITSMNEICRAALQQAREQQNWLNIYLEKGKAERRLMFIYAPSL